MTAFIHAARLGMGMRPLNLHRWRTRENRMCERTVSGSGRPARQLPQIGRLAIGIDLSNTDENEYIR